MRTLVLVTGGKREEVWRMGVCCFEFKEQAEEYCKEFNTKYMANKYWGYAEIIQPDMYYEVNTENCFEGEISLHEPDNM